jgi:DNA invertase Pin-like site-specific DNA recombinase
MTKVAIYARYSSDKQREASIEDQIRLCEERAAREGWEITQRYTDHGISGASLMRPGAQALLRDAQDRAFAFVLTEPSTGYRAIRKTSPVYTSARALRA